MSKYKKDIIRLRKQGKSYDEIKNELDCSKGTVSYHCKQEGVEDIGLAASQKELSKEKKLQIRKTYRNHTKKETAKICDVSTSSVIKYGESKGRKVFTLEEKRKKARQRKRKDRKNQRKKAVKHLGGECEKCGFDDCVTCFDFHHKRKKEKKFTIGSKFGDLAWKKIKQEVEKCKLLCANCHRKIHHNDYRAP